MSTETGEGNILDIGAVRVARLQPDGLELVDKISNRQLFALAPRRASLEFIGRQDLDGGEQTFLGDALKRRLKLGIAIAGAGKQQKARKDQEDWDKTDSHENLRFQ